MKGKLVKTKSPVPWCPFMVRYETGNKFFNLLKNYDYAYVHPYIPDLPSNFNELKIGDEVEFYFVGDIHVKLK